MKFGPKRCDLVKQFAAPFIIAQLAIRENAVPFHFQL